MAVCPIFINFAADMKELQFSIVVLMVMMCSALILLLPQRVRRDVVINRSRWFMTGALTLIGAQLLVHVNRAVEQWLATGGHLKAGITSPVAAGAMGIPRYQLTAWVKASGHNSFTR
ncbi:MAG: hypothetical protein IJ647_08230 [Prevotella sp.]|nr:hypothetical protein [Prevotella sp.]